MDARRPFRGQRSPGLALLATVVIFAFAPPVSAQPTSIDQRKFTEFIAKEMRETLPQADIRVDGPLQLTVKIAADNVHDVSLDTIYSSCTRDVAGCAAVMQTFVEQTAAFYRTPTPVLDRKALRITVRRSDYVEMLRQNMTDKGGPAVEHIAGDYWAIVVADLPTVIRMVSVQDLEGLGLSPDQALALGRRNLAAAMRRQIKRVLAGDRQSVMLISGSPYASSLFAFPDLWSSVADAFGGKLLVAAPASDVVLCGDGAMPGMAAQMAATARTVMAQDEHPLAATVFEWSPAGWTPAPGASHGLH